MTKIVTHCECDCSWE